MRICSVDSTKLLEVGMERQAVHLMILHTVVWEPVEPLGREARTQPLKKSGNEDHQFWTGWEGHRRKRPLNIGDRKETPGNLF